MRSLLLVLFAIALPSHAAVQTADFHGFTLRYDDAYMTLVDQAEFGNDGMGFFKFSEAYLEAEAGQALSFNLNPTFEVEAKTDSYLISYHIEAESNIFKSNGASVDFNSTISADLHGGWLSDAPVNTNTLLSSLETPEGSNERWEHSFEAAYFGATTHLTLNGFGQVNLNAQNADGLANFSLLNQISPSNATYQFCLSIGSVQPVPEPASWILFGTGLALAFCKRRQFQNH